MASSSSSAAPTSSNDDDHTMMHQHGWYDVGDVRLLYHGAPKAGGIMPLRLKRIIPSSLRYIPVMKRPATTTITPTTATTDNDDDGASVIPMDGRLRTLIQLTNIAPLSSLNNDRMACIHRVSHSHPCILPIHDHWYDHTISPARYSWVYDTTRSLTLGEVMRERLMMLASTNSVMTTVAHLRYHHQWMLRCAWQLCHVIHTIYQQSSSTDATSSGDSSSDEKQTDTSSSSSSSHAYLTSSMTHGHLSSDHIYMCDSNGCTTPWSMTGICCSTIRVSYPWLPPMLSTDVTAATATTVPSSSSSSISGIMSIDSLSDDTIHELRTLSPLFPEVAPERLCHIRVSASSTSATHGTASNSILRNNSNDMVISPSVIPTIASDMWSIGCILLDGIRGVDPLKHYDDHFCYAACTPTQLTSIINDCGYKHKADARVVQLLHGLMHHDPLLRWSPHRAMIHIAALLPEIFTPDTATMMPLSCRATLCQQRYDRFRRQPTGETKTAALPLSPSVASFDLIRTLVDDAVTCDLLISLTVAAARLNRLFFVNPLHVAVTTGLAAASSSSSSSSPPPSLTHFMVAPYGKIPMRYNGGADGRGMDEMEDIESGPWLDYDRIRQCLSHVPSYRNMITMANNDTTQLYHDLLDCDALLPSLLQWIITATSYHILPLSPAEQFPHMATSLQFQVTPHDHDREVAFQALKRQAGIDRNSASTRNDVNTSDSSSSVTTATDGAATASAAVIPSSVWGFHGSDTSNWHSIMRTGLKMMSHTSWANSAPVYGPGIYLSMSSRIAMNYAKFSGGWNRSTMGPTIRICALCEVIHHPLLPLPAPFYVIPHSEWVMIRYLFVYQNPGPADVMPTSSTGTTGTVDHHCVPDVHVDQVVDHAIRTGHRTK